MSLFKKITDVFTTDEDRFRSARLNCFINHFNSLDRYEINNFPEQLISRPISLSKNSPLYKLSLIEEINLYDVILHIVILDIFHELISANSRTYITEKNLRMFQNIKSINNHIKIESHEFDEIIEDCRKYLRKFRENNAVFPSSATLFIPGFKYEDKVTNNNLFKSVFILMGFKALICFPLFEKFHESIDSFFKEQNSNSFKNYFDLSNTNLLKDIFEKNLKDNIIPKQEIDRIHKFIWEPIAHDANYSTFLDFFLLVLIYNGQTLQTSQKNIADLRNKLDEISRDWNEILIINMRSSNFNKMRNSDSVGYLAMETKNIFRLIYQLR